MFAGLRNRTTLFLVVAGLVALPGLAVAGTGESAAEPAPAPGAVDTELVGAADAWFADLLFGMVPDWVQDWLDSESSPGPHERPQQEDVPQRGTGEEPSFGGVDDPAGPWA
jgi:hypothetical protein